MAERGAEPAPGGLGLGRRGDCPPFALLVALFEDLGDFAFGPTSVRRAEGPWLGFGSGRDTGGAKDLIRRCFGARVTVDRPELVPGDLEVLLDVREVGIQLVGLSKIAGRGLEVLLVIVAEATVPEGLSEARIELDAVE